MSSYPCDCAAPNGKWADVHSHHCAIFKCGSCGGPAIVSPPNGETYCENCCPDHQYEYERGEGHRCKTCFAEPPHDWLGRASGPLPTSGPWDTAWLWVTSRWPLAPVQLLANTHLSSETAYVVADYPYGFRLRCQIRYWLEVHPKRGVRFMSQTTNPKRGNMWNTAKASTYALIAGAMFLDDAKHVQWDALSEYSDLATAIAFRDKYGPAIPELAQRRLAGWINAKIVYERQRDTAKETA